PDDEGGRGWEPDGTVARTPWLCLVAARRVVERDVTELDRPPAAIRPRRQRARNLPRRPISDFPRPLRGHPLISAVQDYQQPPHGSAAALKQIYHPPECDQRPRQHTQVHAERHERAHRDRAA